MADNQEHREQSSSLGKVVGGLAVSMAGWAVYQGLATMAFKGAGRGIVNLLRKSPGVTGGLKRLRAQSIETGSTDLWELLKSKSVRTGSDNTSIIGNLVHSWDTKSAQGGAFLEELSRGKKARAAALRGFRKMEGAERSALYKSLGFNYLKTAAYEAPMFYVGERAVGIFHRDSRERQKHKDRAWYNLPGHVLDFAKWLPTFVAFDAVGRIAMTAAPGIKDLVRHKTTGSLQNTAVGDIVQTSLESLSNLLPKVDSQYRRVRNAMNFAFKETGGDSGQGIFLKRDSGTRSKYRVNHDPVKTAMRRARIMKRQLEQSRAHLSSKVHDVATMHLKTLESVPGKIQGSGIDNFFKDMGDDLEAGYDILSKLYASSIQINKVGIVPRLLGLVPAHLRHVKKANISLYKDVYRKLTAIDTAYTKEFSARPSNIEKEIRRYIWGVKPGGNLSTKDTAHLNLIYKEHVYYNKRTNKLVDLSNVTPRALLRRGAKAVSSVLSLGRKADTLSLFQLHTLRSDVPRIAMSADDVLLNKRALREEYKHLGPRFRFMADGVGDVSETKIKGMAVYIQAPGSKGKAMFIPQPDGYGHSKYVQITDDKLRLFPAATNSKMLNILAQKFGLLRSSKQDPVAIENLTGKGVGAIRKWLYNKYNLFGGDGLHPSAAQEIAAFAGPTNLKRLFNKAKHPLLREHGFNYNAYKKNGDIDALTGYLEIANAALVSINSKTPLIQRREVFKEIITPLTGDKDMAMLQEMGHLNVDMISSSPETAFQALDILMKHKGNTKLLRGIDGYNQMNRLYKQINQTGDMGELYNIAGEEMGDKIRRFITNYRFQSILENSPEQLKIGAKANPSGTLAERITSVTNGLLGATATKKDQAMVDMMILNANFQHARGGKNIRKIAEKESEKLGVLLEQLKVADEAGILDTFSKEIGSFVKYQAPDRYRDYMFRDTRSLATSEPFIPIHKDIASVAEWAGLYAYDTFGQAMDFMGLAWNRAKYRNILPGKGSGESVAGLFGKRALLAGAVYLGYKAVDTFLDVNPMFDGTFLDEGLTVAAADQIANARLAAAKVYDLTGVTAAAKYMEGLMPKSTSIIPGAAAGFAIGGIPGALAGAVINRYTQTQLQGGPLSALALLPPLAPFTADLTKGYDELKDIYSGKQKVPYRKGRGWSLGTTPLEGGRIKAYVDNWYSRLKSQYKATDALYGSKIEQFIFQDIPVLDFSLGDLVAPQYLQNKHYEDRPYVAPDVPFSEVPIIGPVLGATLGKAYNAIHPFASNDPMHVEEARAALYDGPEKGQYRLQGYGGLYSGSPYLGEEGSADKFGTAIPGYADEYRHGEIASPTDMRQVLSEQVYRGFIEPAGLTGFATSALLWDGGEPFTDQPVFDDAGNIDSFRRSYWDENLGDMFFLNEGFRRLFPRPRTSYEKVGLIRNKMPDWVNTDLKYGDPFCLTPDTYVEVQGGLKRADDVRAGDLIRTVKGRFYPVKRVVPHPVNEDIYNLKLSGIPWNLKVTGEHPFYINKQWVPVKDIPEGSYVMYPLLHMLPKRELEMASEFSKIPDTVTAGAKLARLTVLLYNNIGRFNSQHFTVEGPQRAEVVDLIQEVFQVRPATGLYKSRPIKEYVKYTRQQLPPQFYSMTITELSQFMAPLAELWHDGFVHITLPSETLAYNLWNILLQHRYIGRINGKDISFSGKAAYELALLLGLPLYESPFDADSDWAHFDESHNFLYVRIESIEREPYTGDVYGFEVDNDDSFCMPAALSHNTKIPYGELLLPGAGYESANDVKVDFPSSMELLGESAYTQALKMIGLEDPQYHEDDEVDKQVKSTVQDMLKRINDRVRLDAQVYDPYARVNDRIDALLPDQQASGGFRPVTIETVSGQEFKHLGSAKQSHIEKLNAYMGVMKEKKGSILYVNKEDPKQTKTYNTSFDPGLYSSTMSRLESARQMASTFISQGYGSDTGGYSYLDRAKVMLNAAPFSREFKDTWQIVQDTASKGLYDEEELTQLERLERQRKSIMWQHEMYPLRFNNAKLLSPDTEYNNYSLNYNIRAAADYSLPERIAGSVWEKFTHLKSPLHSKLFGTYSPEEQYERNVLYGREMKLWNHPIDHFLEPYSRGLKSVTNPIQGALSWGTGGLVAGGPLLASITMPMGMVYGTIHGIYRAVTGTKYVPDRVKEMGEMSEYFDKVKFYKAQMLYQATGDYKYQREMEKTSIGWTLSGIADEGIRQHVRHKENPSSRGYGHDQGFGSKWRGILKGLSKKAPKPMMGEGAIKEVIDRALKSRMLSGKFIPNTTRTVEEQIEHITLFDSLVRGKHLPKAKGKSKTLKSAIHKTVVEDLKVSAGLEGSEARQALRSKNKIQHLQRKNYSKALGRAETGPGAHFMRRQKNPAVQGLGSDRGFGSPWYGIQTEVPRIGDPSNDAYAAVVAGGISGLPSWDKPYYFPFLSAAPEDRDDILKMVDPQMRMVLQSAWGRGDDIPKEEQDLSSYFKNHYQPRFGDMLMDPAVNIEDVQLRTVEEAGFDQHDFGLGWKQQMQRIENAPFEIRPVNINAESDAVRPGSMDISQIQSMIRETLYSFGIQNPKISIRTLPGSELSSLNITVSRDRTPALLDGIQF